MRKGNSPTRGKALRPVFALCQGLPVCLLAFLAGLQSASARQADSADAANQGAAEGESGRQTNARRAARPPADIVADNLDRVAATADQILEVLNRDAGLMVEFKRLVAQDAGASGQILEESDLTDSAIMDRLREELRSRVLATTLLQRYGYLLPKVNPDSELAAERNLALQDRAHQIARAAERDADLRPQIPRQQTANCDSQSSFNCDPFQQGTTRSQTQPRQGGGQSRPLEPTIPREQYPLAPDRQETINPPRELRVDTSFSGTRETILASLPQTNSGSSLGYSNRGFEKRLPGNEDLALVPPGDISSTVDTGGEGSGNPLADRLNRGAGETRYPHRAPTNIGPAEFEPVRMVRQPNPYADAPSLYDLYVQASAPTKHSERFGLDVFQRGAINVDALPMDLPVGPDYVVRSGDGLSIDLWGGVYSQRLFRTVDREGRLLLPEAGPLLVSGKSLGEVQESVQRVLRTQFRDVSADVSLLRLRTVRVYVVGEVAAPGAYDISSLSTPLNALFAAGGVTPRGSLRHLEHYRGRELLEEVDAYDLLLHGIRGDLKRLENGDSLRVPPLGPSITVDGMVRRPFVYEMRSEENLNEVLDLAGGILPAAALQHIEVQRLEAHEKRTMLSLDVGETNDKDTMRAALEKFQVRDGDEIHIFPIAPYNSGAVYLEGHVLRPGRYSFREGMKLTDLISSYKDLLREPSERYAEIVRIKAPENRPVVESFNLKAALEHPESAPKLEPLDTVRIFGRYDLEATPEILITGEVRAPGQYRASGQERLRDAIYQAGGITQEAWLENGQLFRPMPDGSTKVFSISLGAALAGDPLNNIIVEPRDRILVHRQPERVNPPSVFVRGEVARPGRYPLTSNMRVSDLVRSAGGFLRGANPASGDLVHYSPLAGAASGAKDSGERTLNLTSALAGDDAENVLLRDGDVLTVPQRARWKEVGAAVTIRGEVANPGIYGIEPGERLSSLLKRAGGMLPTAYPQAAVFERVDVRAMQQQSRQELIQRLEQESTVVRTSVNTNGADEVALQQAALQQRQRIVEALRRAPVSGRLVVRLRQGEKGFANTPDDIELRAGDPLEIPKQPGFVLIVGQAYNSNAISYTPGTNAGWYTSRAGGPTSFANKRATFIIRANGAVISGSNGLWSGGVLSAAISPGDTIVVPERVTIGSSAWKNVVAIAQVAQAGALAAAVAIP